MLTRYALPVLSACALAFALIQMTKAQHKPPPVQPPVDPGIAPFVQRVSGAGIVEPETENIAIGTNLPGIVQAVNVRVGDIVKAGAVLFELDDRQLKAEWAVRDAALKSAQAQLRKLEQQPRPEELPPLEAKLAEAEAILADKLTQYERVKNSSAVSPEELSSRKSAMEVAQAQAAKAKADRDLVKSGAWEFDLNVARAAVKQAQALISQTETELERLKVAAPRVRRPDMPIQIGPISDAELVAFQVLQVNVRPGEYVATAWNQPLIVLGHVGKLRVRVDIDENDIGRFRSDRPGVASPRGNPERRFPLKFVRVEPYVIPKRSLTGGNTERVDTRVLQVIYTIDVPETGLYVGQQLDVAIEASDR